MNREDLFEQMGELDEELLWQSATPKKLGGFTWKRWVYMAAGVAAAAAIIIFYCVTSNRSPNQTADSGEKDKSFMDEEFVSVQSLLKTDEEGLSIGEEQFLIEDSDQGLSEYSEKYMPHTKGVEEQSLMIVRDIPVGKYKAVYEKVDSVGREMLWESLGRAVSGTDCFYYVSGHKDMQYLISLKDNELSLWKFSCFQDGEYPYRDVLELVYDIHSADDIRKILSKPADIDNSDQGKALQEKIGNLEITDRGDIESLYQILTSLTCLGDDHWELVELSDDLDEGGINAVWRGRYLSITTAWGNVIDTMKYTSFSNMFYEYNGIAYKKLGEQQADEVKRILQISNGQAPS